MFGAQKVDAQYMRCNHNDEMQTLKLLRANKGANRISAISRYELFLT